MAIERPSDRELNLFAGVDLAGAIETVGRKISYDHRDPMLAPYGDPDKITSTQKKAWEFYQEWKGFGPMIAMIAAKGAAKTHFGGSFALNQAQWYPESLGCLVSNTFGQAKDNGLPIFQKIAGKCGIKTEFFNTKKIRGKPYTSVVVVYLAEDVYSYMLVRSYDAILNFEGVEIDWLWSEEGQDATYEDFRVPFTRNRGQYGDNAVFYAAMPEDGSHWQYRELPKLGMVEEKKYVPHSKEHVTYTRSDKANDQGIVPLEVGIMYEFSVFENRQNVGNQYIQRNSMAYTGVMYDRYVLGQRGTSRTNKMVPNYNGAIHTKGFMPRFLKGFEYSRDAWLIMDFNIAPACATIWQQKPWNDKWELYTYYPEDESDDTLRWTDDAEKYGVPGETVRDLNLVIPPNREVYVQVGEIECWQGGTQGMINMFVEKYPDYRNHLIVNGDASGNAEKSSSTTTDWEIVRSALQRNGYNFALQPGLIVTYPDSMDGTPARYSNPPRKDTFNVTNALFRDNVGRVHMVMLPASEYESLGAAGSIGAMVTKPDGIWDESCDKKEGKEVPRTHFTDTVRYFAYLVTGGSVESLSDDTDDVAEILAMRQRARVREQYGLRRDEKLQPGGLRTMANNASSREEGVFHGGRNAKGSRNFIM